jgi:GNAT superfamily N-acetyltransferase
MDAGLVRTAITVNWQHLALGHEQIAHGRATFVRNRSLPLIYDANFLFGVTAAEPPAITQLVNDAEREYAHAAQITIRTDPFTPPAVDGWLLAHGWSCGEAVVLMLSGGVGGSPALCEVRPVRDDRDWASYATLKALDVAESLALPAQHQLAAVTAGLIRASRLKTPPVAHVLAIRDGQPIGFCSAWGGIDGVGLVEDLFVHPAHRKQGVATALLRHCVARARTAGTGPIALVVHPANTARLMYLSLGWQPVAVCHQYGRATPGGTAASPGAQQP